MSGGCARGCARNVVARGPKTPKARKHYSPESFLRVRKVFARMIEIVIKKSQICLVSLNNFQTRLI